jgi:hypothetical protein
MGHCRIKARRARLGVVSRRSLRLVGFVIGCAALVALRSLRVGAALRHRQHRSATMPNRRPALSFVRMGRT